MSSEAARLLRWVRALALRVIRGRRFCMVYEKLHVAVNLINYNKFKALFQTKFCGQRAALAFLFRYGVKTRLPGACFEGSCTKFRAGANYFLAAVLLGKNRARRPGFEKRENFCYTISVAVMRP